MNPKPTFEMPYIFISYSHDDSVVVEIIKRLKQDGYNIWWDYQNRPGDDYHEYIAGKISRCGLFFAFLSESYNESKYCRTEFNYACGQEKIIVPIYLESVKLNKGLEMHLAGVHSIHFKTIGELFEDIYGIARIEDFIIESENLKYHIDLCKQLSEKIVKLEDTNKVLEMQIKNQTCTIDALRKKEKNKETILYFIRIARFRNIFWLISIIFLAWIFSMKCLGVHNYRVLISDFADLFLMSLPLEIEFTLFSCALYFCSYSIAQKMHFYKNLSSIRVIIYIWVIILMFFVFYVLGLISATAVLYPDDNPLESIFNSKFRAYYAFYMNWLLAFGGSLLCGFFYKKNQTFDYYCDGVV